MMYKNFCCIFCQKYYKIYLSQNYEHLLILNLIFMKKKQIIFTWILALGMLAFAYFCWQGFEQQSHFKATAFMLLFLGFALGIAGVWVVPPQLEAERQFFQKKCRAIFYAVKHTGGYKEVFCREVGQDMYEYCLNVGIIHEYLETSDPDADKYWEATRLAFVIKCNLEKDGFLC